MDKMDADRVRIEADWKNALLPEFSSPYMGELREFLRQEAALGKRIYPRGPDIFSALNLTPLGQVKVVILGQDPYHGPNQAHGLSFSVRDGVRLPPSLLNIFKELSSDLDVPVPRTGDLTPWARQGVLLLNTVLTVEEGKAASHRNRGWEKFTDRVIHLLSERGEPVVFILWGSFAQSKIPMIRVPPHAVIKSVHPSPLSAFNGFFGSKPFSRTNSILRSWGKAEIDWRLEP
jgi:uracil-DNA glycosylase